MEKNKISDHITYAEATKSQTATRNHLTNDPGPDELSAMQYIAKCVFEPLRIHFDMPIAISSFFRSRTVNSLVGGSGSSQHVKGEAMDIDAEIFGGITNKQIFDYIKKNLPFDQLIWEFGDENKPAWVHVSLKVANNRHQVLKSVKMSGKTVYENYN